MDADTGVEYLSAVFAFVEGIHSLQQVPLAVEDLRHQSRIAHFFGVVLAEAERLGGTEAVETYTKRFGHPREVEAAYASGLRRRSDAPRAPNLQQASELVRPITDLAQGSAIGSLALRRMSHVPEAVGHARGAVLISAFASLESLIRSSVALVLRSQPSRLRRESLTLEDLEASAGLDAVRELVIERKVDQVMSSVKSWSEWLAERGQLGFQVSELAPDERFFLESMQRRHLLVHTAGRVSRRYLAEVPWSDAAVGDQLKVDEVYLRTALAGYLAVGVLLSTQLARNAGAIDDNLAGAVLTLIASDDLCADTYWPAMRRVATYIVDQDLPFMPEECRVMSAFAQWMMGEDISEDIRLLDSVELTPTQRVVVSAIAGQDADGELQRMMDAGSITPDDLKVDKMLRHALAASRATPG